VVRVTQSGALSSAKQSTGREEEKMGIFDLRSYLIAIAGSLLILYGYRLVKRPA